MPLKYDRVVRIIIPLRCLSPTFDPGSCREFRDPLFAIALSLDLIPNILRCFRFNRLSYSGYRPQLIDLLICNKNMVTLSGNFCLSQRSNSSQFRAPTSQCHRGNPLEGTSSIYVAKAHVQQPSYLRPRTNYPEIYRKPKRKSILFAQLSDTLP